MDPNKTIDEGAPFGVNDEAVDPEDQETVMFGQRHLFQDVDLAAAKRQAETQTTRKRVRYERKQDPLEDPSDTVVSAPPVEGDTDPVLRRGKDSKASSEQIADDEPWQDEETDEPDEPATIEVAADEAEAARDQAVTVERAKGRKAAESKKRAKDSPEAGERQVAERRPSAKAGGDPDKTADASSSCRMCGKSVGWPKARRFRGRKHSSHGFRCDTCGNVFCGEHVQRISGFWESLLHHGRFRCLLCALGQMARQAEQVRKRITRAD